MRNLSLQTPLAFKFALLFRPWHRSGSKGGLGEKMKIAETVTFGGAGLDRAAQLRDDPKKLDGLFGDATTKCLAIWRGKPLLTGDETPELVLLAPTHPIFDDATEGAIFLGRDENGAYFARDISAWEPDELPETMGVFYDPSEQHHPDVPPSHRFAELRGFMAALTPLEAELSATARAILNWHRSHRFCAQCGQESVQISGGWQRSCTACNAQHFPRTDPVVIMLILHGNNVLLGRSPGWPDGVYSLLAGFVEPGETIEAAVRREVLEESGIKVGAVDYLASQPWPFPSSLMFGCRGVATSCKITIDPTEIEDAIWVSREQVTEIFAGLHPTIKPARRGAIAHFLLHNWLADCLD